MASDIVITIRGDKETIANLNEMTNSLSDMTLPLSEASSSYLNVISSNFISNGQVFGEPWPPLSKATIAEKKRLMAEGKAIAVEKPLVRTGLLSKSFDYRITKNHARIYNEVDYANVHQEGATVQYHGRSCKVPRRVLMKVDAEIILMVAKIFETWVRGVVAEATK